MGSTIMYLCADNITCTNKILAGINISGTLVYTYKLGVIIIIMGKPVEPHTIFRVPSLHVHCTCAYFHPESFFCDFII